MSEIPNVIGGDTATAAWANDVKNRTAMRYATAAARDASNPGVADGVLAYLQDTDVLTIRANNAWETVGPLAHTYVAFPDIPITSSAGVRQQIATSSLSSLGGLWMFHATGWIQGVTLSATSSTSLYITDGTTILNETGEASSASTTRWVPFGMVAVRQDVTNVWAIDCSRSAVTGTTTIRDLKMYAQRLGD